MFDIGWTELLFLGVLAILVVGPKDLPRMMRVVGRYVGKVRGMAREFQRSFDDMAREAELEELKQQVTKLKKANPVNQVKDALNDPVDAVNKAIMNGVPPEDAHRIAAEAENDAQHGPEPQPETDSVKQTSGEKQASGEKAPS